MIGRYSELATNDQTVYGEMYRAMRAYALADYNRSGDVHDVNRSWAVSIIDLHGKLDMAYHDMQDTADSLARIAETIKNAAPGVTCNPSMQSVFNATASKCERAVATYNALISQHNTLFFLGAHTGLWEPLRERIHEQGGG